MSETAGERLNGRVEFSYSQWDTTKEYIAYPSDGMLVTIVRETGMNYSRGKTETVAENRQSFPLADDGKTVEHTGEDWEDYARRRHERLVRARFGQWVDEDQLSREEGDKISGSNEENSQSLVSEKQQEASS